MEAKACDDPVPSAASRAFGRSLLSNIHVFKDLSPDDLTEVEQACRYRRCCPQEQIIDRDGTTADVFFVVRGRVRVVNYSMSGREISFADLGEGDHFGELAVLDSQPRSASVVAVEDSLILALSGRVFVETLVRHPRVALRTMARLARMVRAANDRIMDLSTLAAQNRVHAEIVHQAADARSTATRRGSRRFRCIATSPVGSAPPARRSPAC